MTLSRQPFVAEMYSLNNNGPIIQRIRIITKHDKRSQHALFQRLIRS